MSFLSVFLFSCVQEETDKTKPVMDLTYPGMFPENCDTLYFGDTFTFRALFTDNAELGSYSIEIHENFDHHSHSTETSECAMFPEKEPVNPFVYIMDYPIPSASAIYEANDEILIPSGNQSGDFDEGDYHFYISVTDREGWSEKKGYSIKIIRRKVL